MLICTIHGKSAVPDGADRIRGSWTHRPQNPEALMMKGALPISNPYPLQRALVVGDRVPHWQMSRPGGGTVNSLRFSGKTLVLCFMPYIYQVQSSLAAAYAAAMASDNPTGVDFVLVAGRDSIRDIEAIEDFAANITKKSTSLESSLTIAIDTDGFVDALFNRDYSRLTSSTHRRIFLIDRNEHVEAIYEHDNIDEEINAVFTCLKARAPVRICEGPQVPLLLIPNALSQEMCSEVIATFNASESFPGLTKILVDGVWRNMVDTTNKRRRDAAIPDGALAQQLGDILFYRISGEIIRAFCFPVTRCQYLQVGCYDAEDRGGFSAHRDNDVPTNSFRRWALSLNLNDDYDGGGLHFPEYGCTYHFPAGTAAIFSCSLLHEAKIVTRGKRYVIVGFFYGENEHMERMKVIANKPNAN